MESSTNSSNPKPVKSVFSVPSIDEIDEYERQRPKILSSFKPSRRVARAPPSSAPKPAASVGTALKADASSSGQGAASKNDGRPAAGGASKIASKSPSKSLSKSPAKSQTRSPVSSPSKYSGKLATKRSGQSGEAASPSSSSQSKRTARSPRSSQQENRQDQSWGSSVSQSKKTQSAVPQKSTSQISCAGVGRTNSYGNKTSSFRSLAGSARNTGRQPGGGFDSGISYQQTSTGSNTTSSGRPNTGANAAPSSSDSRIQRVNTYGTSSNDHQSKPPSSDIHHTPSTSAAKPGASSASDLASTSSAGDEGSAASVASRPVASRMQFPTATDFVRSRGGKIGSAFANKFRMLGTAEEYKVPQSALAANQPTGDGNAVGTLTANKAASGTCIIVNARQRGNPILKYIRNIPWEFGDIVPDYVMGRTTCALYLSLRYHHLNPNYIHDRLMELGHKFELRVLLVQVDVKDPHHSVKELARLAILADCTLMLAWSSEEAGRYLETYKAYENKPVDALKEKIEQDHLSKMTDCLTTVKSVNKTDVITLLANYGTFEKVVGASKEELALLPGFGPQKANRLSNMFTEPFLRSNKRRKVQKETESSEQDAQAT